MEYARIIAEHSERLCADIDYCDSVSDYIVYCDIDFYGYTEEYEELDIYEYKEKRIPLGKITGYLILCSLMSKMGEDPYTVCDDYCAELEMVMSIITNHNNIYIDDDIFYIEDNTIVADSFAEIMNQLPYVLMKHYHSYPKMIVYYPEPLPFETEKPMIYKAKEQMAQIIARDIMAQNIGDESHNSENCNVQLVLDEEQQNYILGRWNDYNVYPESAKDLAEFERYEKVGFSEMRGQRLLYRVMLPDE